MKIRGYTPGAWFNHERFSQRKAKGYALSKRFDHRLFRWLNHLLFKLLPPRWYLRTQGIKLYREPRAMATITYLVQDGLVIRKKQARIIKLFGGAWAIVRMLPFYFKHGFCESEAKCGPRYWIPPANIMKVEWYDPVLEDYFTVKCPAWRGN